MTKARAQESKTIPAIYINLDTDNERRVAMETALRNNDIPFERLSAVLGAGLSDVELAKTCPKRQMWWRKEPLSNGEIGCFLSHVAALRRVADGEDRHVCILEDDVNVDEKLGGILKRLCIKDGVGIVKLEGSTGPVPRIGVTIARDEDARLAVYGLPKWRAGAYIVEQSAARQLVERMQKMYGPLDQMIYEPWRTGIIVAEYRPFPMRQTGARSSIDEMAGYTRSRDYREFLQLFVRLIKGHIWMLANASRLIWIVQQKPSE